MGQMIPVNDAALALNISVATLKRRLKAGYLKGKLEQTPSGKRWFVELPNTATEENEPHQDEPENPSHTSLAFTPEVAKIISLLEQERDQLWREVEARRQEVRELHILLQRSQAQLALPTTTLLQQSESAEANEAATATSSTALADRRHRSWWRFWS